MGAFDADPSSIVTHTRPIGGPFEPVQGTVTVPTTRRSVTIPQRYLTEEGGP